MQDDERLLIFAKFPEKGMVKTRLAHKTGEETAVELYRCFVETRSHSPGKPVMRRRSSSTPRRRERP